MKKITLWLLLSAVAFCLNSYAELMGEEASYVLDTSSSRTSWLLNSGQGKAKIVEYREDEKLGPSYLVTIDYELDIIFHGEQKGSVGLLVPAAVFSDQFFTDLVTTHPVNLGSFEIDFEGMSSAIDSENNHYNDCLMTRIFNIDQSYLPTPGIALPVTVMWHEVSSGNGAIKDLQLKMLTHPSVPVLGAVQIDISGTASGIDVNAGFDLVP